MSLKVLAKKIKQENKLQNRAIEELFLGSLDDFIIKTAIEKENKQQRLAFRPSSYYKCSRKTAYFLLNNKKKVRKYARSERILNVGTKLHEWVQTDIFMEMNKENNSLIKLVPKEELPVFGQQGIEFIKEHSAPDMEIKFLDNRFTRKIPISAMVDGVIDFTNKIFIFEFKTIKPDDYDILIEPLKDHIKQGAIYSLCLSIPHVMFLYLNKGTQHWKSYFVEYTKEQLEWVVNRIQSIEQYVLNNELPPKEKSLDCKWCPYNHYCENEIIEKIA